MIHARRNTAPKTKAIRYTESEVELLKNLWPVATTQELLDSFPGRSQIGLIQKAASLGLKSLVPRFRRGNLRPLLDGSIQSFYWLGFVLADGHITKTGQLTISVMEHDDQHLQAFASYIRAKVRTPYRRASSYATSSFMTNERLRLVRRVSVQDPHTCLAIRETLGLSSTNKTVNPPDPGAIKRLSSDNALSLFIGFFDGDGSTVTTKFGGHVENHRSWFDVHMAFFDLGLTSQPIITSKGTSYSYVPKSVMRRSADFIQSNAMSVLNRKWAMWINESSTRDK